MNGYKVTAFSDNLKEMKYNAICDIDSIGLK